MEVSENGSLDQMVREQGVWAISLQAAYEINAEIKTDDAARQFVLEELEAMSGGDEYARAFARESGYAPIEYSNAISNPNKIDIRAPQFLLREFSLLIKDPVTRMRVLCAVVDHTMRMWKLGKYKNIEEMNFENIDELGV